MFNNIRAGNVFSGGQAKTLMFVHISPEPDSIGETISTLKFAKRVATVELGAARVNKDTEDVKELKEQVIIFIVTSAYRLRLEIVRECDGVPFSNLLESSFRLLILRQHWQGKREKQSIVSIVYLAALKTTEQRLVIYHPLILNSLLEICWVPDNPWMMQATLRYLLLSTLGLYGNFDFINHVEYHQSQVLDSSS